MSEPVPPRQRFEYCPQCATAGNAAPPDAPYFDCAACGFRFHFNAAVAVSSVAVRESDGALLFIRRARDPGKGKLAFPGGFVDPGESVDTALIRETQEEVGLAILENRYLGSFVNYYPYRGIVYPVADLFFVVRVAGERATLAEDEASDSLWLDPATVALEDIAFPSMREALVRYCNETGISPNA